MCPLHHGQGTPARGPILTRALPPALHPLALVALSLCTQAYGYLFGVTSARFGPMKQVPPNPPPANAALVRLPMYPGWSSLGMYACVCMLQHVLDMAWTIQCTTQWIVRFVLSLFHCFSLLFPYKRQKVQKQQFLSTAGVHVPLQLVQNVFFL